MNLALIAWCACWLGTIPGGATPDWPWFVAALVAGLLVADFVSGLVHWTTDTWFDEIMCERVVSISREHHLYPHHLAGYGVRDYVGYSSWPTALLFGPVVLTLTLAGPPTATTVLATFLCLVVCGCMVFGTYAHELGHVRARSPAIRLLQRWRLLISPRYHRVHHGGGHDVRYCVINGWANPICDRLGVWRALERLVQALTGAVPRRNDDEWSVRFAEDPTFVHDPVPSLRALRQQRRTLDVAAPGASTRI